MLNDKSVVSSSAMVVGPDPPLTVQDQPGQENLPSLPTPAAVLSVQYSTVQYSTVVRTRTETRLFSDERSESAAQWKASQRGLQGVSDQRLLLSRLQRPCCVGSKSVIRTQHFKSRRYSGFHERTPAQCSSSSKTSSVS